VFEWPFEKGRLLGQYGYTLQHPAVQTVEEHSFEAVKYPNLLKDRIGVI
jgi:hypothetical protein